MDEEALEVDAALLPRVDEFLVGAGNLGQNARPGAVGDLGFDPASLVVEAVLAGAEAGAVDVTVGVEVDESLAELIDLDGLRTARRDAGTPLVALATTAQLWPEHFDHAATMTVTGDEDEPVMANVGASPGDDGEALPYLYVGPHGPERPGDDGYWNAPFGAVLHRAALAGLSTAEARREGLAFLREGLVRLAGVVRSQVPPTAGRGYGFRIRNP